MDRIKQVAALLKLLASFDMGDVKTVLEAVGKVRDSDRVRDWVEGSLVIAEIVTGYIPGEGDDAVVATIKRLYDDDYLDALIVWVQSLLDGKELPVVSLGGAYPVGADGDPSKMIPWPVMVQLAIMIVQIIRDLRK